ncbi:MAG: T9SS type A sorting domain-containing protein [Saprospiraceae bacterium]|nr:T9SS type A sorting domain-containing protein [Saprospiraceae bacterium]
MRQFLNYYPALLLNTLLSAILLLSQSVLSGQTFQTAIGYPLPTDERAPSGLITNAGEYLLLGTNTQHPAGFFNPAGDLQLVWLNSTGAVLPPSKMIGQDVGETGVWIEKATGCNGQPGYIIAANERNGSSRNMLLTQTDLSGTPLWVQRYGIPSDDETSACVKQDGAGNFILVGTKIDGNTGVSSVYAVKTDCSGKFQWSRTYTVSGGLHSASVTAFATLPGCANTPSAYYVTGTYTSPTGAEEVFILSINTNNGSAAWLNTYDIAPNTQERATCIQGSCSLDPKLDGDLWVSGYSQDPNTNDKKILMLRTDINGTLFWANHYEVLNSKQEWANHFKFTGAGDLALTGKAEAFATSDGSETGHCLLLNLGNTGSPVHWTRLYTLGDASQGNRVAPTANDEYYIMGHSQTRIQGQNADYNLLAIKTDAQGLTESSCYHSPETEILKQTPKVTPWQVQVSPRQDFSAASLLNKAYDDKQTFCPAPPVDPCQQIAVNAAFSTTGSGATFTFTDLSTVASGTIFSWDWDFGDGNTAFFTSPTNPSHTYANSGTYLVCLIVTAGNAGMLCRDTFCREVVVTVSQQDCPDNLLLNGQFTAGLNAGNLGSGGTVSNWSSGFNTPQVITHDSCADMGAIQMWGNQVVGEGIVQPLAFLAGNTYEIQFCGMWMPTVQDSVRFRFRASTTPLSNYFNCTSGTCDEIFLSPILSTTWATYTSALWTPTQNYSFLNITIWNNFAINDGAYVSWARIDDICVRNLGQATATGEASAEHSLRLFPNPTDGEITLELGEALPEPALAVVTDLLGRRLQQTPLAANQVRQTLSLRDYPAGVYLVQVLGKNSVWHSQKIIKN